MGGTERGWQHLRHQARLCRSGQIFSHSFPGCTCFNRKLPVFEPGCLQGCYFDDFNLIFVSSRCSECGIQQDTVGIDLHGYS